MVVRFPILMYHALWPGIDDSAELERGFKRDPQLRDPGSRLYALDQRVFDCQMRAIVRRELRTPRSWDEIGGDSAATDQCWITFDDGHASNRELALPVLQEYGLRGIFFITTDWIGQPGFMNEAQLREMREAGMLLGTHGCSHAFMSGLPDAELERELRESKARLEGLLGEEAPAMALPGGRGDPRVRKMARQAGYRHLFTSRAAFATPSDDPLDWPRIALTNRQPEAIIEDVLDGDDNRLKAMARSAALRETGRRLMGERLYQTVRDTVLRNRAK